MGHRFEGSGAPLRPRAQKCPTSRRNRAPLRSKLRPTSRRNQCPISSGIRSLNGLQSTDRLSSFTNTQNLELIDSYLYADMQAAGVMPAGKTTDFEFIR